MIADRFKIVALCLGLALILMAGTAMAGTTSFTALKYAKETGVATTNNYNLPMIVSPGFVTHSFTNYLPVVGQNFLVKVKLTATPDTVVFVNTGDAVGKVGAYTLVRGAGGLTGAVSGCTGAGSGGSYGTITFTCNVTENFDVPPVFTWYWYNTVAGAPPATPAANPGSQIRDVPGIIAGGGTISISITTWDAVFQSVQLDAEATDVTPFIKGVNAVSVQSLVTSSRVIDITSNRTQFTSASAPTGTLIDDDARIALLSGDADGDTVYQRTGLAFRLTSGVSSVTLTLTSPDLTGITEVIYDPFGLDLVVTPVDPAVGFTGSIVIDIPGGNVPTVVDAVPIVIHVDGTTPLANREINIKVTLNIGGGVDGFPGITTIKNTTLLTSWTSNGTVLICPFTNGNATAMNGRIYLWNNSSLGAPVVAQVFTLPIKGVATQLLGTVTVGTLDGLSGMNIKVKEDLLDPLGIAQPYVANGGNLVVILSVEAQHVVGVSNVFNATFSYGVNPLVIK